MLNINDMENNKEMDIISQKDWLLENIVNSCDFKEIDNIEITLNVNGLLVCGIMISGEEYFLNSLGQDNEYFKSLAKDLYGDITNLKNENTKPNYIHLKSAQFWVGTMNPVPSEVGVYWRGRISEISAFSFGKLELIK